jgi:hypothetical protein
MVLYISSRRLSVIKKKTWEVVREVRVAFKVGYSKTGGRCALSVIMIVDWEECGLRILQIRVNFACY